MTPTLDSRSHPARVVVVGAGGHGSELHCYMQDLARSGWMGEFHGHFDDNAPPGDFRNMRVLGAIRDIAQLANPDMHSLSYITAVGSNAVRIEMVRRIENDLPGWTPWNLIHPSAQIGEDVVISLGTLLAPNTIVTTRVRIGRHCILNVKVSVSHDTEVGDFVNLNPGVTVCGKCRIGTGAYIGAGAVLIDGVSVGTGSVVGAGAVVVRNIPDNCTAVGVPARVIKQR